VTRIRKRGKEKPRDWKKERKTVCREIEEQTRTGKKEH
jgi:hypothetical protein